MLSRLLTRFLSLFLLVSFATSFVSAMEDFDSSSDEDERSSSSSSSRKRKRITAFEEQEAAAVSDDDRIEGDFDDDSSLVSSSSLAVIDPFRSPDSNTTAITNHCKKILSTLSSDEDTYASKATSLKSAFRSFLQKIPYTTRMGLREKKAFYQNLCFCLALCLISSVNGGNELGPVFFYKGTGESFIVLQNTEHVFILNFCVFDSQEDADSNRIQRQYHIDNIVSVDTPIIIFNIELYLEKDGKLVDVVWNETQQYRTKNQVYAEEIGPYQEDNNFFRNLFIELDVNHDAESFSERLATIFNMLPFGVDCKREKFFHALTVYILSFMGNGICESEVATFAGRADMVLERGQNIYIIEFKLNGTLDKAHEQIQKKSYVRSIQSLGKIVYYVGVNVITNSSTKPLVRVECSIKKAPPIKDSPAKHFSSSSSSSSCDKYF